MLIDSCIIHLVPKPSHVHILVPRERVIAVDPSSSLIDLHNLGGDLMARVFKVPGHHHTQPVGFMYPCTTRYRWVRGLSHVWCGHVTCSYAELQAPGQAPCWAPGKTTLTLPALRESVWPKQHKETGILSPSDPGWGWGWDGAGFSVLEMSRHLPGSGMDEHSFWAERNLSVPFWGCWELQGWGAATARGKASG